MTLQLLTYGFCADDGIDRIRLLYKVIDKTTPAGFWNFELHESKKWDYPGEWTWIPIVMK